MGVQFTIGDIAASLTPNEVEAFLRYFTDTTTIKFDNARFEREVYYGAIGNPCLIVRWSQHGHATWHWVGGFQLQRWLKANP